MKDKILIVDDETDIVSMLKDYFEYNGYDTMTAVNGLEAIEIQLLHICCLWFIICLTMAWEASWEIFIYFLCVWIILHQRSGCL